MQIAWLLPGSMGAAVREICRKHSWLCYAAPYQDAKKITEYLPAGHDILSVMGSSEDVSGSGKTVLGGDSILSDSEWIWRGDLWFYVWNHRVQLPEEFLARLRGNNYLMPAENEPLLVEIAKYVRARL